VTPRGWGAERPGRVGAPASGPSTDGGAERPAVLDVQDLTVAFPSEDGWLRAVDGVSFAVRQGEIVGLVGESTASRARTR
jgi:ABC-type uncharacterized transport system ATPase subunit